MCHQPHTYTPQLAKLTPALIFVDISQINQINQISRTVAHTQPAKLKAYTSLKQQHFTTSMCTRVYTNTATVCACVNVAGDECKTATLVSTITEWVD